MRLRSRSARRRLNRGIDDRVDRVESTILQNHLSNLDEHWPGLQEELYAALNAYGDLRCLDRFNDQRESLDEEIEEIFDEMFDRTMRELIEGKHADDDLIDGYDLEERKRAMYEVLQIHWEESH